MLTTIADLEQAITNSRVTDSGGHLIWLLGPGNWFELLRVAHRAAAAGREMEFTIADADGKVPLANADLLDFSAAYEVIREWWPQLSGDERPNSLAADAFQKLVESLRNALHEAADSDRGDPPVHLGFPDLDHELLSDTDLATRLWGPFLGQDVSPSMRHYVTRLLERDDIVTRALARPWLRVLLQRHAVAAGDGDIRRVLLEIYNSDAHRDTLLAEEEKTFSDIGLHWLTEQLVSNLRLQQSVRRSRPFRVRKPERGTVAQRDRARITVLVPAFAHEQYIVETIRSVLNQTTADLRVLVVDDSSPDATVAMASTIDDPRVEVRSNTSNLGLGNSVLAALDSIETPYLALLNSDDLFHPERLQRCLEVLDADTGCSLVATGVTLIDQQAKRLTTRNTSPVLDGRNVHDWVQWYDRARLRNMSRDLFGELLERNFLATSSNIVCRTDWLRARSGPLRSLKYCLDWQLFLDAAREGCLRVIDEDLIAYRLHPSNTVWFTNEKRWAYSIEVDRVAARAIRDHIAGSSLDSATRAELALRDICDHLSLNTEIDWTGLYLNELIGGHELERNSTASSEIATRVATLQRMPQREVDAMLATSKLKAQRLEVKMKVHRDTVYALRGALAWQSSRLRDCEDRLRTQEADAELLQETIARQQEGLASAHRELAEVEAVLARTKAAETEASTALASAVQDLERLGSELREARSAHAQMAARLAEVTAAHSALLEEAAAGAAECDRLRSLVERRTAESKALETLLATERAERQIERGQLQDHLRAEVRRAAQDRERDALFQGSLAMQTGEVLATQHLQQSGMLTFRGTRLIVGSDFAKYLRRLRKWRRKLSLLGRALRPRLPSWRTSRPTLFTSTIGAASLDDLRIVCAEAAADLMSADVRDGNEPLTDKTARTTIWHFPERSRSLLRHFERSSSGSCADLLGDLSTLTGGDPSRTLQLLGPHLTLARSAERADATLLVSGGADDLLATALAARLLNKPWCAFVDRWNTTPDATTELAQRQLVHASLLVARSQGIMDALQNHGVAVDKLLLRPWVVSADEVRDTQDACITVVVGGRCAGDPGWHDFVAAAQIAAAKGAKLKLAMLAVLNPTSPRSQAGAAWLRAALQTLPQADLRFEDQPSPGSMRAHIARRPAIFVAPWREGPDIEAIDLGLLGAMATGLPIVSSAGPAALEAVRDRVDGILTPTGRNAELADSIVELTADADLRSRLGAAAKKRHAQLFCDARSRAALARAVRGLLQN